MKVTKPTWIGASEKAKRMLYESPLNEMAERYAQRVLDVSPYGRRETLVAMGDIPAGYIILSMRPDLPLRLERVLAVPNYNRKAMYPEETAT